MRPCVIIPHYCHERQIAGVLSALEPLGLATIVVDDGSPPASVAVLRRLLAASPHAMLNPAATNQGKGAAVLRGLALARAQGFSHAVQIDADGQHRIGDIRTMLQMAREHPTALISGLPQYDVSAPGMRRHGRKISVFWVRVHTWSRDILDPMCGFRVYPVDATLALAQAHRPGHGMEFDIEIMVRSHWARMPVLFLPTPVAYPPGGISHFRMFRDNVRISLMHTRLFFGMLRRSAWLLRRTVRGAPA
ncbi:MAG: glycosyltransferase family 2 protein [Gammaproteobacteria bacterium]|nr:glycosyltransferase family 2 protein [Gammaproteobacteria bacterium]